MGDLFFGAFVVVYAILDIYYSRMFRKEYLNETGYLRWEIDALRKKIGKEDKK